MGMNSANRAAPGSQHMRDMVALGFICLSVLLISVDATIVNVALPTLSRVLHASTSQLQWIVDAYTLVITSVLLAAGSLGDRYGRRGGLAIGLVVFAAMSAVASQTDSAGALIAARGAMGVGAAVIFPTTLALITNIFTTPVRRAMALGVWSAMTGVGVAIGPLTGGWFLQHFWWGSVFLVNVPVAAIAVVGVLVFVPTSRDPATPPLDFGGFVLSAAGITAIVYTVIECPDQGWTSVRSLTGFGIGALITAVFVWWELRGRYPMLDLEIFTSRRFTGGSVAVTAGFLTLFGFVFLITQYFQFIKGYTPFGTGVRLTPVALAIAAASVLAPRVVRRVGTTVVVVCGLLIFAAGLAWASRISGATSYTEIVGLLMFMGCGLGATTAPATESIMGSLSADKAGVGSAVNDTTRELGGTLGVAIVGSVFASVYRHSLLHDWRLAPMPESVRGALDHSMAAAQEIATRLPAHRAMAVHDAVQHAFLRGMQYGCMTCAGIAAGTALVVALVLPAQQIAAVEDSTTTVDEPEPADPHPAVT